MAIVPGLWFCGDDAQESEPELTRLLCRGAGTGAEAVTAGSGIPENMRGKTTSYQTKLSCSSRRSKQKQKKTFFKKNIN